MKLKVLQGGSMNSSCAVAEIDTANKKQNNICVTGFRITIWQSLQVSLLIIEQMRSHG